MLTVVGIGCGVPARAGVYAIADDGSVSVLSGVDAPAPIPLAAIQAQLNRVVLTPSVTVSVGMAVPTEYVAATNAAAIANGLAPDLLAAVVSQESRWRSESISRVGAIGLGQLMPSTAHALRVDARDPVDNLYGAAHYLKQQMERFHGNIELALAAYNAGPSRVLRAGVVPAIRETQNYVAAIMGRLSTMSTREY